MMFGIIRLRTIVAGIVAVGAPRLDLEDLNAVAELEENGQEIKSVTVDQSGTVLVHSEPAKASKADRAKKSVSLNEQERLDERAAFKAKREAREAERKALGLKSGGPDDNDDGLQANERKVSEQVAQENADKERPDPLLNESAAILADAIVLLEGSKPLLTQVFPKAPAAKTWAQ